jgi:NADH:ubiquinone reductase (H+-translocating)
LGHAPDAIEVTLISRTNHHLFQPLLYQVATGILSEGEIALATRDVLKKKKKVSIELAEVTGFDLEARHVTAVKADRRNVNLSYDSLIVAAGAGPSYFGHDEYAESAPGMKTLADALDHRARIFGAFEMAELENDPEIPRAWLTFAVVGGGPTGVEIAGQIGTCRGGRSNTISGDLILARHECFSSTVAQRSWLLSVTNSPAKRPAN